MTINKFIPLNAIERNEDGIPFNRLFRSQPDNSIAIVDLYFSIFEPFDENGLPSMEKPLMHDSILGKECVIFKN